MSQTMVSTKLIFDKAHQFRKVVFMTLSAVLASASIIAYYNLNDGYLTSANTTNSFELAMLTLMPYMISAVIAAMTAVSVMAILPTTKVAAPAEQIIHRLRDISDGDLTVRVRLNGEDPLKDVGMAFNAATSHLGDRVAHWKVINRQQWGVLGRIRQAVEKNDQEQALRFVAEMEQNWDRIAEIEQELIC